MPAAALLKFDQGEVEGTPGEALEGVLDEEVTITNADNTDVLSWQIDLLYVDPASGDYAIEENYATANSSTPTATFEPDIACCWRWQLKVWSVLNKVGDPDDTDIRIFAIREPNGLIVPPPQLWPRPLPLPQSGEIGAKPHEYNIGGQPDGWAGNGADDGLLNQGLRREHLPITGGAMRGPIAMQNHDISGFQTAGTTTPVELEGGAALAVAYTHTIPEASLGATFPSMIILGARIFASNVDESGFGYADLTLSLWYDGDDLELIEALWESHLPPSWVLDVEAPGGRVVDIQASPDPVIDGRMHVSVWYHPAKEMS